MDRLRGQKRCHHIRERGILGPADRDRPCKDAASSDSYFVHVLIQPCPALEGRWELSRG